MLIDDSKPMWQALLVFLIPLILSNVLQSANATMNSIFLGRMVGVYSLAAASAFFPMLFLLISFVIGISSGSTVLIGQAFGAGNHKRMNQVAGTTLSLVLILAAIVAVAGALTVHELLVAVGTPPTILPTAESYARAFFLAMPIFFVYLVYTTFLRGTGDAKTPFRFLLLSTVLNVIVTPPLIGGWFGLPRFETNGAVYGGAVVNFISVVALLAYLARSKHPLRFDREMLAGMRIDWPTALAVIRIGVPTAVQLVMVSLSEIAVLSFVNHYGARATAAYGAVNQVVSYVQFPAISIGIASSIFGAQSIGARRNDRLPKIVHAGVTLNYIVTGVLILIVYALSWEVLGLFLTDVSTLNTAHELLTITLWSYAIFGNNSVLSGIMRSSGAVLWPTLLAIVSIWGVEVPVAYVLSHRIGIDGIWIAYPIAFAFNLAFQSSYYFLFWKKREIVPLVH
jgi:MATE family, multidrug efflux pump